MLWRLVIQRIFWPDEFNFAFVTKSCKTIKANVHNMVQESWQSSTLPKGCNVAFITLTPKSDNLVSSKITALLVWLGVSIRSLQSFSP